MIGDGYCNDQTNNNECNFDGGDCCGSCVNMEFCTKCLCLSEKNSSAGGQLLNGNGYCDDGLNKADCNFDGGDCCNPNANTDYCTLSQCLQLPIVDNRTTITGTFLAARHSPRQV